MLRKKLLSFVLLGILTIQVQAEHIQVNGNLPEVVQKLANQHNFKIIESGSPDARLNYNINLNTQYDNISVVFEDIQRQLGSSAQLSLDEASKLIYVKYNTKDFPKFNQTILNNNCIPRYL
jgi:hypothetical protein